MPWYGRTARRIWDKARWYARARNRRGSGGGMGSSQARAWARVRVRARVRARTAVVIRPRAMVVRAEASRVPRAPRAATRGPPKAVPIGPARMSRELRAARTWASVPGGLASWKTPMDRDIQGPKMTPPAKNAASPAHSGAGRPPSTGTDLISAQPPLGVSGGGGVEGGAERRKRAA